MPVPHIFCIGFNKCGTTSLHRMFHQSGLKSLHCETRDKRRLTNVMLVNMALNRRAMEGLEDFVAFSDLSFSNNQTYIEGCRFFKLLNNDYPDAFFILNTRDIDGWIRSRTAHNKLLHRVCAASGLSEKEVLFQWREVFSQHHHEVRDYFHGNPNFLEFNIEMDDPKKIAAFLAPVYSVNTNCWTRHNASSLPHSFPER